MTNQQNHPITPPPELLLQLEAKWLKGGVSVGDLLTDAYCAGADQELEACCEWLQDPDLNVDTYKLRAARRPKPPSLKEQALEAMGRCDSEMWCEEMEIDLAIIRTALESLPS